MLAPNSALPSCSPLHPSIPRAHPFNHQPTHPFQGVRLHTHPPCEVARLPGPVSVQAPQVHLLTAHRAHILLTHHGPTPDTQVVEAMLARQLHAPLLSLVLQADSKVGVPLTNIELGSVGVLECQMTVVLALATSACRHVMQLMWMSGGPPPTMDTTYTYGTHSHSHTHIHPRHHSPPLPCVRSP